MFFLLGCWEELRGQRLSARWEVLAACSLPSHMHFRAKLLFFVFMILSGAGTEQAGDAPVALEGCRTSSVGCTPLVFPIGDSPVEILL